MRGVLPGKPGIGVGLAGEAVPIMPVNAGMTASGDSLPWALRPIKYPAPPPISRPMIKLAIATLDGMASLSSHHHRTMSHRKRARPVSTILAQLDRDLPSD